MSGSGVNPSNFRMKKRGEKTMQTMQMVEQETVQEKLDYSLIFSIAYGKSTYEQIDTQEIKKYIKEAMKNSPSVKHSNIGGYQSGDIVNCDNSEINKLIESAENSAKEFSERHGFLSTHIPKITNMWFNVNNKNDHNNMHIHPHSHISGTFYVNIEDADSENWDESAFTETDGYLEIFNPLEPSISLAWSGLIENYNIFNSRSLVCNVKNNDCILFAPFLQHRVRPHVSDYERISISFNFQLIPKEHESNFLLARANRR